MAAEGAPISMLRLCLWFSVPRRTIYYQAKPRLIPVDGGKSRGIKTIIERFPSYGYRRISAVLGWNCKVVQRILQRKGWQVRKRTEGHKPRVATIQKRHLFCKAEMSSGTGVSAG